MPLTFQTRIVLLVSAGLAPLLLFGTWLTQEAREQVHAHMRGDLIAAARDDTRGWRTTLVETRGMLLLIAADPDIQAAGPDCAAELANAERAAGGVSRFVLVGPDGGVRCAGGPVSSPVVWVGDGPTSGPAGDAGQLVLATVDGAVTPALTQPVRAAAGGDAEGDGPSTLLAVLRLGSDATPVRIDNSPVVALRTLLTPGGLVVASSGTPAGEVGANLFDLGLHPAMLQPQGGLFEDVHLYGAPHVAVVLPLGHSPEAPESFVLLAVPAAVADAPADRYRNQLLGSGWVAVFVVLLALGLAAERLLVRPMDRLVRRAARLAWPDGRPGDPTAEDPFALLEAATHHLAATADRGGAPFRRAVEVAAEGVLIATPAGRVVSANPAATRLLGLRQDQILGASLHALLHPEEAHAPEVCPLLGPARDGRVRQEAQASFPRGRGGRFEGRWSVHPVEDGLAAAGLVVVFEDRTAERGLEGRLKQAARMEALGQLAGSVAHDFNNLLTAMLGYADLLSERVEGAEERRDVEEIIRAAQRASGLSQQILTLSRGRSGRGPVDINSAAREMERLLARLVGERVSLRLELDPDAGTVRADAGQVEQLLLNLVVNARDALPEGGRIDVRTRHHPARGQVELLVSDNGVGIPDEARARLFEPFYTTKPGGTGLGLTTVARILTEVAGQLEVESEPGVGTTFRVWLPVANPEVSVPVPQADPTRRRDARVWVVEDDEAVRALAHRALVARGYSVVTWPDAERALEGLAAATDLPQLLVTDMVLPGMGGEALAQLAAERVPGLRVLYLTGYDARVERGQLLRKPFTARELAAAVAATLELH